MKTTVVPAQVTTVEDKVAGRLGMTQIVLLVTPVFFGSALYAFLPPFMKYSTYKLILMVVILSVCGTMAVRIKGKLLLFWVIAIAKYNVRPRFYVFDKNSSSKRDDLNSQLQAEPLSMIDHRIQLPTLPKLTPADISKALALLDDPARHLSFGTNRKGGLYVRITEVKEQS